MCQTCVRFCDQTGLFSARGGRENGGVFLAAETAAEKCRINAANGARKTHLRAMQGCVIGLFYAARRGTCAVFGAMKKEPRAGGAPLENFG